MEGVNVNRTLLQAVIATLEETRSIRETMSGINGENLSGHTKQLLQSVFPRCDAIDAVLEEALAGSCHLSAGARPREEITRNDQDVVLSGIVR
jgi:hypothetical protein